MLSYKVKRLTDSINFMNVNKYYLKYSYGVLSDQCKCCLKYFFKCKNLWILKVNLWANLKKFLKMKNHIKSCVTIIQNKYNLLHEKFVGWK